MSLYEILGCETLENCKATEFKESFIHLKKRQASKQEKPFPWPLGGSQQRTWVGIVQGRREWGPRRP